MCTFLFFRDQASTVANYDVYEMLFILRVFIWINFVSSLCVVISRFTVFFSIFLWQVRLQVDEKNLMWESSCV